MLTPRRRHPWGTARSGLQQRGDGLAEGVLSLSAWFGIWTAGSKPRTPASPEPLVAVKALHFVHSLLALWGLDSVTQGCVSASHVPGESEEDMGMVVGLRSRRNSYFGRLSPRAWAGWQGGGVQQRPSCPAGIGLWLCPHWIQQSPGGPRTARGERGRQCSSGRSVWAGCTPWTSAWRPSRPSSGGPGPIL